MPKPASSAALGVAGAEKPREPASIWVGSVVGIGVNTMYIA